MHATFVRRAALGLLAPLALAACDTITELDDLEVINRNNPDAERVFKTAENVEAVIGGAFVEYSQSAYWFIPQVLQAGADELTVSWGNFGLQDFSSEPRVPWNNSSAYSRASTTEFAWSEAYKALSGAYDGLRALDADPTLAAAIDADRARAFAKFTQGMTLGWLALVFDSAFVLEERAVLDTDTLVLLPYPNVLQAAIGFLDEAIALAAGKSWVLEPTWINGNANITAAELVKIANSFAARFQAQAARTPAEAANSDWANIISRVDNGITQDIGFLGDALGVWFHGPIWYHGRAAGVSWGRGDYKTIGYTEVGAGKGYDNWLATPVPLRDRFELDIPDRRITPGPPPHTNASRGLYFTYFQRLDMDPARGTYHFSFYSNDRFKDFNNSGGATFVPMMTVEELQLYKAEGLVRLGQPGAAAIVNNTRVALGQLPPATDADADLAEKLYYEMQMAEYVYCNGCAYFNRRRWGPLAAGNAHHFGLLQGTQLHFAMPGAELELFLRLTYSYGGAGAEGGALQPSTEPFCRGPGCGGAGAAPPVMAGAPVAGVAGTQIPASLLHSSIAARQEEALGTVFSGVGSLARYH